MELQKDLSLGTFHQGSDQQCTSHICMVRPANFGYNDQTGNDNAFQHENKDRPAEEIKIKAVEEFDEFVSILQGKGIEVTVFNDTIAPNKPDAVFPNNWLTFHSDNTIITYPMFAPVRRAERRRDIIEYFLSRNERAEHIDLSEYEKVGVFLEGTGSMVLDRVHRIAYACKSNRTHDSFFERYSKFFGWEPIIFSATDRNDTDIYHTNVMMALGEGWAVICEEALEDPKDRNLIMDKLYSTGYQVIPITYVQMMNFAGNILQVNSRQGMPYIVLSQRAYESLDEEQLNLLNQFGEYLIIPINFIETYGGGGVRCMMAEVFGDYL